MKNRKESIREIFSMLTNLCIPTINQVIKEELNYFLLEVEKVLEERALGYLVEVLLNFNLTEIEEKHDTLNIKFVELTYAIYEIWLDYIHSQNESFDITPYKIDKTFIDKTSDQLFTCLLTEEVIDLYYNLHQLDDLKERLIRTKIIDKYQDNVISGCKKEHLELKERIRHVFKITFDYLVNLDADIYLFEFIEDYEQYCLMVISRMADLDHILIHFKERYLVQCVDVFEDKIDALYTDLENKGISINLLELKLHLLEFLKLMIKDSV